MAIDPTTGLAPEAISGDSLTQFVRALANYLQGQGAGQLSTGEGTTNTGIGATGQAWNTMAPSVDYWNALLSGNQQRMAQAVAPTAQAINSQYDAAQRSAQTNLPRGGFSAGLASSLPYQKAAAVGNLFNTLQPTAAQGLLGASQLQGGLAGQLIQTGLSQSGLGANLLGQALQGQLTRRGQNVSQSGQALGLAGGLLGKAIPSIGFSGSI